MNTLREKITTCPSFRGLQDWPRPVKWIQPLIFSLTVFIVLQLAQYLDEYVVGQQEAKKVLSVA